MSLSIIIPAYNEEKRIGKFLKSLTSFCRKNLSDYEIIVVNDGSTDKTEEVVKKHKVKLISYMENRGKGYAVKKGIFSAKKGYVVFMDADGSTRLKEILPMIKILQKNKIVVGVRNTKESKITVRQPLHRVLMGKIFNNFSNFILDIGITDMLCGFKGFEKGTARKLFNPLFSERWAFDVEIMYRARKNGYKITPLPIEWADYKDSKMNVFTEPIRLLFRIFRIKQKVDLEKHLKPIQ